MGGYFDAAGCICLTRWPQVVVGHRHREELEWWQERWGGRIYATRKAKFSAEYFEWRLQKRDEMVAFLEEIRPYLVVKAEKADEVLAGLRRRAA